MLQLRIAMSHRLLQLLASFLSLILLSACGDGCSCGGEPTDSDDGIGSGEYPWTAELLELRAGEGPPSDDAWAELTTGYASHLPPDTVALAVARGFSDVAAAMEALKPRIRPIFDLAVLETEIRNTFGFDISRHVTFRENGIVYEGGFMLAFLGQQPVLGFYLLDADPFLARAQEVLRRQPFNLRAPIESATLGESRVRYFARRPNDRVDFAVIISGNVGLLVPRINAASDLRAITETLATVDPAESLAGDAELALQLGHFRDYPGFLFVNGASAAGYYRGRMGDQLSREAAFALDQAENALSSLGGGLSLDGNAIAFRGYASVTPEQAVAALGIDQPLRDDASVFRQYARQSSFLGLRLAVKPAVAWETLVTLQGRAGPGLRERATALATLLGAELEGDLDSVLSGNMLVTINRLAPLSLARAQSPGDYADGLGLMALFQLANPERAAAVLDHLASSLPEVTRLEEQGQVSYMSRNDETNFGHLLLRDDMLILSSDRMLRHVGTADDDLGSPEIEAIISAPLANGLFLSFEQLQPIALLLNWPQPVRELLALLDTLSARAQVDGAGVRVDGRLVLSPLD